MVLKTELHCTWHCKDGDKVVSGRAHDLLADDGVEDDDVGEGADDDDDEEDGRDDVEGGPADGLIVVVQMELEAVQELKASGRDDMNKLSPNLRLSNYVT